MLVGNCYFSFATFVITAPAVLSAKSDIIMSRRLNVGAWKAGDETY